MRASWRQAASTWMRAIALAVGVVVPACNLDRTGYLATAGGAESGVGAPDARTDGPGMDAGTPVVPESEGGIGPRDLGPVGPGDLGPVGPGDLGPRPDARPMDPRDARPMDPPDFGPMELPDFGPMELPDLGLMELPDAGPPLAAEDRCNARYGDLDGYVLCFATEVECGFNVTLVGDCELSCFSRGGICLRAYNNPNGPMQECTMNFEETCATERDTEICVCTSF